jgi:hypothetical protein
MSTYRSRAADQRTAEDAVAGHDLMCAAQGCPHRWSVDAGAGKLCSAHAWAPSHRWPQITQERLDALAERALQAQRQELMPPPKPVSHAEKTAILRKLREVASAPRTVGRTAWARQILANAKEGVRVSPLVMRMAQEVVGRLKAMRERA